MIFYDNTKTPIFYVHDLHWLRSSMHSMLRGCRNDLHSAQRTRGTAVLFLLSGSVCPQLHSRCCGFARLDRRRRVAMQSALVLKLEAGWLIAARLPDAVQHWCTGKILGQPWHEASVAFRPAFSNASFHDFSAKILEGIFSATR